MGGSELIERGVVNAARLLRAARATGVPVFQFIVSFGEAEGGLGLWGRKVPTLGRDRRRLALGGGRRAPAGIRPTRC